MKDTVYINIEELIDLLECGRGARMLFASEHDIDTIGNVYMGYAIDNHYIDYNSVNGYNMSGTLVIDNFDYEECLDIGGIELFKDWIKEAIYGINNELDEPYYLEIR